MHKWQHREKRKLIDTLLTFIDAGGSEEGWAHATCNGFCIGYDDPVYEEQEVVREVSKTIYVCRDCGAVREYEY